MQGHSPLSRPPALSMHRSTDTSPAEVAASVGLGWSPRISISNKFPGTACLGTTLQESVLVQWWPATWDQVRGYISWALVMGHLGNELYMYERMVRKAIGWQPGKSHRNKMSGLERLWGLGQDNVGDETQEVIRAQTVKSHQAKRLNLSWRPRGGAKARKCQDKICERMH